MIPSIVYKMSTINLLGKVVASIFALAFFAIVIAVVLFYSIFLVGETFFGIVAILVVLVLAFLAYLSIKKIWGKE